MKKQETKSIAIAFISIALIALFPSCSHDESLYRIQKDGLYGFINESGKTIIEPKYEYVGNFTKDGYALIILDASISPIKCPNSSLRNRSLVQSDTALKVTYNYIDKRGNIILPSNEVIYLKKTEPWLLYNNPQDFVDKFKSHTLGFVEFVLPELNMESNRYLFQNDSFFVGYKDIEGTIVIEPKFCYGCSMSDGMTFVIDSIKPFTIEELGNVDLLEYLNDHINCTRIIDANGKYLSDLKMHDFSTFNKSGYAWVSVANIDTSLIKNLDWFRIDRTGRITCGPINPGIQGTVYNNYWSDEPLYSVAFSFGILGTYYTWVDDDGKYITDFDNDGTVHLSFSKDERGELFTNVTDFSEGVAGIRMFNEEGESAWIFVNKNLDVLSNPYDSIIPFRNGFAAVQAKHPEWPHMGNWGFVGFDIDSSIVQKIPFNFSEVGSFSKDGLAYAAVSGNGVIKEGYINTDGKFIWETLRKR